MRSQPTRRCAVRAACPAPRLSRAANMALREALPRQTIEPLEDRLLLSVAQNANGFTVVTPSSDSHIYYVSNSGSDSSDGLSPNTALRTIAQARLRIHSGSPDWILLRRGDVFTTPISNWTFSGRSASEPMVIGAYTDPAHPSNSRPEIDSGQNSGFSTSISSSSHPLVSHLYILGVSFEANARNYRQPTPAAFTTSYLPDSVGGSYGVNTLGPLDDFLVEDCSFQYYRTNLSFQAFYGPISNVRIRRSVIADAYVPNVSASGATTTITSEGLYADGVAGLTLEDNVFDHNGWAENNSLGAVASIYNHDAYLNTANSNVVVSGNIFANAGSHGLQARAGGVITNNLFIGNPIAMSFGYVNGTAKAGGVSGEIAGNVVIGDNSINGASRGWGLEIGNIKPASQGGGANVHNNYYFNDTQNAWPAIQITIGKPDGTSSQEVGTHDLTFQNNTVYGWAKALSLSGSFIDGGSGYTGLSGLIVRDNDFQNLAQTPIIDHANAYNAADETWSGNRYSDQLSDTSSHPWFKIGSSYVTLPDWQAIEPTASQAVLTYRFQSDPATGGAPPDAASYSKLLGAPATVDAFLAEERQQSSMLWRAPYATSAILSYAKADFALMPVDAPVASLASTTLAVGGAPITSFAVTYADDTGVDFSTIGSADIQVTSAASGYSQTGTLVGATANADGSYTAIYSIPAPDGSAWSAADNGSYDVSMLPSAVRDTSGKAVASGSIGALSVAIAAGSPGASLVAPDITAGDQAAALAVTYSGSPGSGGPMTVAVPDAGFRDASVSANSYVYRPGGSAWTFTGNSGVTANFSAINSGNAAAPDGDGRSAFLEQTGSFSQSIVFPRASTYTLTFNTAQASSAPISSQDFQVLVDGNVVGNFKPGGANWSSVSTQPIALSAGAHTVVFRGMNTAGGDNIALIDTVGISGDASSSPAAITAASIDDHDLWITGPNGYSAPARVESGQSISDAPRLTVNYTLRTPAGGWTPAYNGVYTITSQAGEVIDTAGTALPAGAIGTLRINIPAPVAAPSALAFAPTLSTASGAAQTINVNYTGGNPIDAASIDDNDIGIAGPNGYSAIVTLIPGQNLVSGKTLQARYSLPAPSGGWTSANNGTYYIVAQPSEVSDTAGMALAGGPIGQFQINIDQYGPLAWVRIANITRPAPSYKAVVTISDTTGINARTIDPNDLIISGPNGYSTAPASVTFTGSGKLVTATYTINAPSGGWTTADNGTYSVQLRKAELADTVSPTANVNGTQNLGSFTVNVDTIAPTVQIVPVSPNPRTTPVDSITIRFSEAVQGVDLADLSLTAGGSNLLTSAQTLTTADGGVTWTLGNLTPLDTMAGNYTLTLNAAGSGITDLAGNALAQGASASWNMAASVVGRWVFYNNSRFDGQSTDPGAADDAALATDKSALLPGQKATFANYTSYARGLNGIMIDVQGLPRGTSLSAADFEFTMGNDSKPAAWTSAPAPSSITVRSGAGVNGSDRITLIWPDANTADPSSAITKKWLGITIKPTAATGLATSDVFYFGNAPGESGNSTSDAIVNLSDVGEARSNQSGFTTAALTNRYDFDRDGHVNLTDVGIARSSQSGFFPLLLIAVPGTVPG